MPEEKKQYTEKDLDALFEKASKIGAVLTLLHFDSFAREKEVVAAALVELISRINAEKGVLYCRGEIEEVLETEDEKGKGYSTYTEVKVLFSGLDVAVGICMKYGPVVVEVLQPREMKLNQEQLQNVMLNASSVSQHFTTYFMSKLLKKEDFDDFQKSLKSRVKHGRNMIEAGHGSPTDKLEEDAEGQKKEKTGAEPDKKAEKPKEETESNSDQKEAKKTEDKTPDKAASKPDDQKEAQKK
ncbi:MAG: hypothetical protein V1835_03330 [Candidatus Micrarchaeota archaeon]